MASAWYPISGLPAGRVHVRVMWAGRQFVAARIMDERRRKGPLTLVWATMKDGNPVYLPPPGEEERWGEAPSCWQPLDLAKWDAPLPEPVTPSQMRMTSERTRFALVNEAEASDLAREMEADREAARANSGTSSDLAAREIGWWRDATGIIYETPPNISLKMVEGRLMRAVACCGVDRFGRETLRISPLLAEIGEAAARALAEIEAQTPPDYVPRFQPLPADADDFLTAMSWFAALYPPEARPDNWAKLNGMARFNRAQKIIVWRAKNVPLSFDEIGEEFRVTRTRATQIFNQAKEDAWRAANGMPPRKGLAKRIDHMALVRERNRQARKSA